MKLDELGENGLIDRVRARVFEHRLKHPSPPEGELFPIILDIGDDTAAWGTEHGAELWTTDTLVDGTHFDFGTANPRELGWKALAVNLSDVAAMGGEPLFALVTLGLPKYTQVEWVDSLYEGLLECSSSFGGRIVGGDLVSSPVAFITVALSGFARHDPMVRSLAIPGERLAVTGPLGASGAGLLAIQRGMPLKPTVAKVLRRAHLRPDPRIVEGQRLASAGIRCAMDISDGLLTDLGKLCLASEVAAVLRVSQIPIHPMVRQTFGEESLGLALSGGEEYELLFTAPTAAIDQVLAALPNGGTIIGEIVDGPAGEITVLDDNEQRVEVQYSGWDHFL